MKKRTFNIVAVVVALMIGFSAQAQLLEDLQYYRTPGMEGLNVFETPKENTVEFEGLKIRVGGDIAMQFQALDHSNDANNLIPLGANVNLPTANLNLDVQLADGVRVLMATYLSSLHHNEAWVKGGYVQVDNLNFIREDFLSGIMDITTIKAGVGEINYGDAHFRRSDNARAIYNPFVGNYIMDAFTTEAFLELNFQPGDLILVAGVSNGLINPTTSKVPRNNINGETDVAPSIYGKIGIDKDLSDDSRVRLTASVYNNGSFGAGQRIYGGDRAGSRYYNVLSWIDTANNAIQSSDFAGRFNPGFNSVTNIQINPFLQFGGFEFFGIYEISMGDKSETVVGGSFTQIGAEALYRFGNERRFYIGGRFNQVSGEADENADTQSISRINVGGGWFMTNNVLIKLEYVTQSYNDGWTGALEGATFNGVVLEAAVSF